MKTNLFIEFGGRKTDCGRFEGMVKEAWRGEGKMVKDIESLDVYYKPEENACYYVVNGADKGCLSC